MIQKSIRLRELVNKLNEFVAVDKKAMEMLFSISVPCNAAMVMHPTIQVGELSKSFNIVRFIGILNGLFGADKDGWGCIAIKYGDNGNFDGFMILEDRIKEEK